MASSLYKVLLLVFLSEWITSAQAVEYVVHIYTADKKYAGTDANVYVKFFDKYNKIVLLETKLRPESGNPYERGDHDIARIRTSSYLGELSKIEVKRGKTSTGLFDDWDLVKIVVEDPGNKYAYSFICNCKLGSANEWRSISVHRPFGCTQGYRLVNNKCEDVNECQESNVCHDSRAICTNTVGSYHCRNCKSGYSYDGKRCTDVNECYNGQSQCKQKCTNTDGSYVCSCSSGFTLTDKYFCKDVDECKLNQHHCDYRAKCVNNPGSYTCKCTKGYENDPKDSFKCINTNECLKSSACDYHTSVKCSDYDGGYRCECKPGYYNVQDNVCKDVNECLGQNTCDPRSSVCENVDGTYRCNCLSGFIPSVNGKSCVAKTCNSVVVPSGAMVRQSRCTQQNANNFNDVCIFYCLPGYQITDPAHTKLTCGADALWKGTPPTCKPVKCQPLQVPASGRIRPASCSSGATFKQTCTFICNDGYEVNGADQVKCLSDGTWSDSVPTCKKVARDLWITCPASISVDLKPGARTADVSSLWQIPQTSHDAKYLTSSHEKTDSFPAGTSFVTWSVSDDNVNFKTCTVAVDVYDKEKPKAVNCPKYDVIVVAEEGKNRENVTLPNVQFTDNVAVKSIEYSHPNPVEIMKGYTKTIVVTAKDASGNMADCTFEVHVQEAVCERLHSPVNGVANCQAVPGYNYCTVLCHGDKVIFNATGKYGSRLWDCEKPKLGWQPTNILPDCVDYADSNGSPCPNGKVLITTTLPANAATVVKVCGDCPSGTYYESNECKLCPAGTYQNQTGTLGPASCIACPSDTSSKAGSKRSDDCKALCAPGFFSADGFHPCQLCKPGEYQTKSGSISCDHCPGDRRCTRHQGASSLGKCGPCVSIGHIEPTGNVQRIRGSLLELFCYVNKTMSGSFNIRWAINLDTPGQSLGRVIYQKKLTDDNGKQNGLKLSVRGLQASASFNCVLENQFSIVEQSVHVAVIESTGSGGGIRSDEELSFGV